MDQALGAAVRRRPAEGRRPVRIVSARHALARRHPRPVPDAGRDRHAARRARPPRASPDAPRTGAPRGDRARHRASRPAADAVGGVCRTRSATRRARSSDASPTTSRSDSGRVSRRRSAAPSTARAGPAGRSCATSIGPGRSRRTCAITSPSTRRSSPPRWSVAVAASPRSATSSSRSTSRARWRTRSSTRPSARRSWPACARSTRGWSCSTRKSST